MRILGRGSKARAALMALVASVQGALQQEQEKANEIIVDYYPVAQKMAKGVGSRRDTYYWPGRRAAAALRTAGKTRRMR